MRLVITGASGFVGQQIIPLLRSADVELLLVGRDASILQSQYPDLLTTDYAQLSNRAVGYDAVLHLAVLNNDVSATLREFEDVNVALLEDVLTHCRKAGVGKIIYPCSRQAAISGSHYAVSKMKAETLLDELPDFVVIKLRLPIVYGDRFSGKLSNLNKLAKPFQKLALNILGSLKPTVKITSVAHAVTEAYSQTHTSAVYVTDRQESNGFYAGIKRLMDVGFALSIMVFFWWLLLAVWAAIKLTSKGPAIFSQTRVGQFGKTFTLYKFRTMYLDTKALATHEVSAAAVLPIGHFLRKSKIDELPQIVNILRGEISLIGPRPCLPSQTELVDARQSRGVLEIQPGITGLAQIRGIDMSDPQKLARVDEEYIISRTLPFDLKILLATAFGRGNADRVREH